VNLLQNIEAELPGIKADEDQQAIQYVTIGYFMNLDNNCKVSNN
jgi:hypothetical protein